VRRLTDIRPLVFAMLAGAATVTAGVSAVGAAAYTYVRGRRAADDDAPLDEAEPVIVGESEAAEAKASTWREYAGREHGPDAYVFGDVTRGAYAYVFGSGKADKELEKIEAKLEAAGDEQHTQVQRLVREAVRLYRARGYVGTINMSHTVAYFTESVSVSVAKPEVAPWEVEGAEAKAAAADEADAAEARMASDGSKAGVIFATLLARLERRAKSWKALSGGEGLDPNLTSSGTVGFRVPVINVGWGVSVSLTVSASTLLAWTAHEEALNALEVN